METHHPHHRSVHKVLAHSYSVFFLMFLLGVTLDLIFKLKIFNYSLSAPLGLTFLILATLLIVWAQKTSRNLDKKTLTKETFLKGPYSFTRSPTHWGLFLLMFGFGLITNAFFVVLASLIALLLTRLVFLREEEKILAAKYGEPYLAYKNLVRL